MPEPSGSKWRTLRIVAPDKTLMPLRSEILGRLSPTGVHGRLDRATGGQFDAYLAGTPTAVDAAEKILRRLANARKAAVKPVTSRAFRSSVGFLP